MSDEQHRHPQARPKIRQELEHLRLYGDVEGQEEELERYARTNPAAGVGWESKSQPGILARGIAERVDDYCATAYVYCREPQPVPRLDVAAAGADIARRAYEHASPFEVALASA